MNRNKVAVIDTCCFISLDLVELVPLLGSSFNRVLLPQGVRTELRRDRTTKDWIEPQSLRHNFERLRHEGRRLPWQTVNQLLDEFGEEPI